MDELRDFRTFIDEKLNNGGSQLSPEAALDEWRILHPSLSEIEVDVEAVRIALADMDAGDVGKPFDDFDREFRKRHGLVAKS